MAPPHGSFFSSSRAALSFQAGFANAGGFLACARFVSHMTGFGTQVGMSLSQLNYLAAVEMFLAPASFLLGAMISALVVDRPMMRGRHPRYLSILFAIFLVFSLVTAGGLGGMFGDFGEPLVLSRDYALLSLLCFACGMQNACFGSLSRGQIRTTHLTGILTDMGVSFVKIQCFDRRWNRQLTLVKRVNFIRIMTFASFSLGSAASAIVFTRVGYFGFGLPAALSLGLFAVLGYRQRQAFKARKKLDTRSARALTGSRAVG